MTRVLAVVFTLALAACAAPPASPPPVASAEAPRNTPRPVTARQRELATIMSYMSGTFDSIAQQKGPGVGTRMRIAPMWIERQQAGEHWLYVEHARIEDDPRPFRQRIYRFTESEGKFLADVFALPGNPRDFVGEWRKPKPFEGFTPERLREYAGCRLAVGHMTMMFWARTEGKACRAENPAAAHEFSEMLVSSVGMKNGEQAYDPAGRLIAGEAGAWDFRRMSREPR